MPAWRLEVHSSLPSTQDLVHRRAEAGEPAGLAVLAHLQTQGRGSRGRGWTAPAGNLNLSVLLRDAGAAEQAGAWALLAGLALRDALADALVDPGRVTLKWPNDVLLDGHKLAGILLDTGLDAAGNLATLVIGCGANLAQAPELPDRRVACLADAGVPPAPETVAHALLARLSHWGDRLAQDGIGAIRAAWLAHAHPIGTPIAVQQAGRHFTGRFGGLDPRGALILETETGPQLLPTGDILAA